jgi:hypothetical protein
VSAAVWWTSLAIAFACGAVAAGGFLIAWRRAGRQVDELAAGKPDLLDELAARQAAGRLGHQNLAWPPHGQRPLRSHAAADWALWAEEMKQR